MFSSLLTLVRLLNISASPSHRQSIKAFIPYSCNPTVVQKFEWKFDQISQIRINEATVKFDYSEVTTSRIPKSAMNKGLKYNKKVRGTGDDWQFERCHSELGGVIAICDMTYETWKHETLPGQSRKL